MGNPYDQFDEGANPYDQFDAAIEVSPPEQEARPSSMASDAADVGLSAVAGANELLPALAGIPVDAMQNLVNLGIAGYGVGKHELTGDTDFPQPIGNMPMSSEWIKRKVTEGMGADPFALPDPTDPTQQNVKMAGTILSSGLLAPSRAPSDILKNIARMTTPAAAAVTAKELFPDEPLAPMVAMMTPAALSAGKQAILPKVEASKAAIKAIGQGYKLLPTDIKRSSTQQTLQGAAGTTPMKQSLSIHNQGITNKIVKKAIGYPKDTPLSHEGLAQVRKEAGKIHSKISKIKAPIKPDAQYAKDVDKAAGRTAAVEKDFPASLDKDVASMVDQFRINKPVSAKGIVDMVKILRKRADSGYSSPFPEAQAAASANKKLADALEGLLERSLSSTNKNLVPELRASRQRIAETYTVQKALKGENVDAKALARRLDQGKPISGGMKDVAEFGQKFGKTAQMAQDVAQPTGIRPYDFAIGAASAVGTGETSMLATAGIRPMLRGILGSNPHQKALINEGIIGKLNKITGKGLNSVGISASPQAGSTLPAIMTMIEEMQNQ